MHDLRRQTGVRESPFRPLFELFRREQAPLGASRPVRAAISRSARSRRETTGPAPAILGRFDLDADGGSRRSTLEPGSTGAAAPCGREDGGCSGQQLGTRAPFLSAASPSAGMGAQGGHPSPRRPSRAHARRRDPCCSRGADWRASGLVISQAGIGIARVRPVTAVRACRPRSIRAGLKATKMPIAVAAWPWVSVRWSRGRRRRRRQRGLRSP